MKATIISIGDEILIGQTVNTNAAWLGEKLAEMGFPICRIVTIADDKAEIMRTIDEAFSQSELLLVTGGLGPTRDDLTKYTLCTYFNTRLVRNPEVVAQIEQAAAFRGRPMLKANIEQADLPEDAIILKNIRGTAQGMGFKRDGKLLISLPGVPYEMKGIMLEGGFELIRRAFKIADLVFQTVMTCGIAESFLAERIADWENDLRNSGLSLAYLPSPGIVKLRITSFRGSVVTGRETISSYIEKLHLLIPEYIFSDHEASLPETLGHLLLYHGKTISCAESCTGGIITHLITEVPGASQYFMGGVVTYSNESKRELLGVSHDAIEKYGAVSREVVEQMALNTRAKFNTDYAIAVTGIAGPDGGSSEKPVGFMWMAVADETGVSSGSWQFGKSRSRNILMAGYKALDIVRHKILNIPFV